MSHFEYWDTLLWGVAQGFGIAVAINTVCMWCCTDMRNKLRFLESSLFILFAGLITCLIGLVHSQLYGP